jgi:phenylpropionate dioxygenase-like ring-hydroxylating dioxygenase large terminal subunit
MRPVFVQRFGGKLCGFENICAHRSYPLRRAASGNGPLICPYHHWQYDGERRATGIPQCTELFGKPPPELGARLTPIELATCGPLLFGRFPSVDTAPSLAA